uniref:Uncharacterized protein n=1 Tax=Aegilops tauschii subsp. strangulata TaxID=200361 RepID=A0A453AQV7_AEGTS
RSFALIPRGAVDHIVHILDLKSAGDLLPLVTYVRDMPSKAGDKCLQPNPTTLLTFETKCTFRQAYTRYYKASSVALDPPSPPVLTDDRSSPKPRWRRPPP